MSYVGGAAPAVLPDGSYALSAAPGVAGAAEWLWVGGLGIIPALAGNSSTSPTPLNVTVGTVKAPWSAIGPYSGTASGRLFSAVLDHGRGVQGRAFSYILAPNVSAGAMPGVFADAAGVRCVVNSPAVQGAAQPSAGVVGAVFWPPQGPSSATTAGPAPTFSCSDGAFPGGALAVATRTPAMVLVRVNGTAVSVSVSQPLSLGATVVVTVSGNATGPGCSPSSEVGGATDFAVQTSADPNFIGAPVTVVCSL